MVEGLHGCWHLIPKINPRNWCRVPRLYCSERRKHFGWGTICFLSTPQLKSQAIPLPAAPVDCPASPRLAAGHHGLAPARDVLSSHFRVEFGKVCFHFHLLMCVLTPSPEMEHHAEWKPSDIPGKEGCVWGSWGTSTLPTGPQSGRGCRSYQGPPRAFSLHLGNASVIIAAILLTPWSICPGCLIQELPLSTLISATR